MGCCCRLLLLRISSRSPAQSRRWNSTPQDRTWHHACCTRCAVQPSCRDTARHSVGHWQLHAASAAVLTLLPVALPQIENGYNEFEGQTVVDLGCGTVRHQLAKVGSALVYGCTARPDTITQMRVTSDGPCFYTGHAQHRRCNPRQPTCPWPGH